MKPRADLIYLSPEALAQATNAGIVKRAVRELGKGYCPTMSLSDDNTLTALFDDNVSVSWPVDVSIDNARCTCASIKTCRHKVIAALAYRESVTAVGDNTSESDSTPDKADQNLVAAAVSTVTDDALKAFFSHQVLKEAQRLQTTGLTVGLHYKGAGEPCDTARLPTATVRFWGGAALASARCDCVRQTACEHIAVGVSAFKQVSPDQQQRLQHKVTLGGGAESPALDQQPFTELVYTLLQNGVETGGGAIAQNLSNAQIHSSDAACIWLNTLLADLENWCDAYTQRSNLYNPLTACHLIAELTLRLQAGKQSVRQHDALGSKSQAKETAMDTVRLNSLGSRIRRDGDQRMALVVVADVDTGTPMVVDISWQVPSDKPQREIALRDQTRVAPGVQLVQLAHGQLLTKKATRHPDGSVQLARARKDQNNLLPQLGDWSGFTQPVRYDSVKALRDALQIRPISAIEARHAARQFVIFSPQKTNAPAYDPNNQSIHTIIYDKVGQPVLVEREHENHTPQALEAFAQVALGQYGKLHHVAGMLTWRYGQACIEPWSFACEQGFVVPDFANDANTGALAEVELGSTPIQQESHEVNQLNKTGDALAILMHHGFSKLPATWRYETDSLARSLEAAGLGMLADKLRMVAQQVSDQTHHISTLSGNDLAQDFMNLLALWQLHLDAVSYGNEDTG